MLGPFVDRIEGKLAVLVVDGKEEKVPLAKLPKGVREGVYLTADRQAVDTGASDAAAKENRERREKLLEKSDESGSGGGDFSL